MKEGKRRGTLTLTTSTSTAKTTTRRRRSSEREAGGTLEPCRCSAASEAAETAVWTWTETQGLACSRHDGCNLAVPRRRIAEA